MTSCVFLNQLPLTFINVAVKLLSSRHLTTKYHASLPFKCLLLPNHHTNYFHLYPVLPLVFLIDCLHQSARWHWTARNIVQNITFHQVLTICLIAILTAMTQAIRERATHLNTQFTLVRKSTRIIIDTSYNYWSNCYLLHSNPCDFRVQMLLSSHSVGQYEASRIFSSQGSSSFLCHLSRLDRNDQKIRETIWYNEMTLLHSHPEPAKSDRDRSIELKDWRDGLPHSRAIRKVKERSPTRRKKVHFTLVVLRPLILAKFTRRASLPVSVAGEMWKREEKKTWIQVKLPQQQHQFHRTKCLLSLSLSFLSPVSSHWLCFSLVADVIISCPFTLKLCFARRMQSTTISWGGWDERAQNISHLSRSLSLSLSTVTYDSWYISFNIL